MYLKEIKAIFQQELKGIYPKEEVDSFFAMFLEHYLKLERFVLVLQPDYVITKEEEQALFKGLARLKKEEPVQYILGEAYFMELVLKVNKHVLIPRPETEELVQWIIAEIRNKNTEALPLKILDIGTGSGCIAIALKRAFPKAEVYALDVSGDALTVAKENARLNAVNINFILADILEADFTWNIEPKPSRSLDFIVSNPPYVRELEKDAMHNNVKKYEPETALFVPDQDPLHFYQAITQFAREHIKSNGSLFFEINQYLSTETKQILVDNDFNSVELRKDIFGNFRMLKAVLT